MVQKVNVTLDNISPLINYSPLASWQEGDFTDQYLHQYYGGTYTQTTQFGASASVTFNGSSVWIFGSKRPSHAQFNITLDGVQHFDTGYTTTNLFQQVLFAGTQLTTGNHTVSIMDSVTDPTRPYLDIDVISYEVDIPDGYQQIKKQSTDRAFTFDTSSQWDFPLTDSVSGTGRVSSSRDANVIYTFEVSAHVEIYGQVGSSHGLYTVQLDGGNSVTYNATRGLPSLALLYQENRFAPGKHTVKISNSPWSGQSLTINYAIVYGVPPSKITGGIIGGIVVGVCGGILLLLVGAFLWRRRSRRRFPTEPHPPTTDYGTGLVTFHTPSLPTAVEREQTSTMVSSDPSIFRPSPTPNSDPSSPHSNSSGSNSGSSRLILHNPSPSISASGHGGTQSSLLEMLSVSESAIPYQSPAYMSRPLPQPGRSNTLLPTSALVLAPVIEGDIRNVRMQVEGRSQDFGPVTFVPDAEHDGNLLPPDYHQATEPFPPQPR